MVPNVSYGLPLNQWFQKSTNNPILEQLCRHNRANPIISEYMQIVWEFRVFGKNHIKSHKKNCKFGKPMFFMTFESYLKQPKQTLCLFSFLIKNIKQCSFLVKNAHFRYFWRHVTKFFENIINLINSKQNDTIWIKTITAMWRYKHFI